jgi:hypothetical protein
LQHLHRFRRVLKLAFKTILAIQIPNWKRQEGKLGHALCIHCNRERLLRFKGL